VFGLHHLWYGNHWQPIPCDPKEKTLKTQNNLSRKETYHHATSKAVTEIDSGACGSASLLAQPANSDCTDRDVLYHYTRSVECEEKLVKLFDGTRTLTAKEDLLHSLR